MHKNDPNYAEVAANLLVSSYMAEVDQFLKISVLPEFQSILSQFSNYQKFLREKILFRSPMPSILDVTSKERILRVNNLPNSMRIKFHAAHVAACCVLFKNEDYVVDMLKSNNPHEYAMRYITAPEQSENKKSTEIMHRINALDSVRMVQLLRLLGLVQRPSSKMYQLGLGAAAGVKDIHYVHALPKISSRNRLNFDYTYKPAADVILFDFDQRFISTYEQYANDPDMSVHGYVGETMNLLIELSHKDIVKRNLVTMLRVEPSMIPDTSEFLRKLCPVIDNSCDLIFSIGSGDSPDTYQDRIDLTASLFDCLNKAALFPVLIKLHNGGTVMEQGCSLQYGSPAASSYEIIYCSLDSEKLSKVI